MKETYEKVENIKSMQEDAIKRARQMHQKAKKSIELSRYNDPGEFPEGNLNLANKREDLKLKENLVEDKVNLGISNLDFLLKDSERSLILVLLLLLFEENGDMGLILALMYLLF